MVPVRYNDDRFVEKRPPAQSGQGGVAGGASDNGEEKSGRDVEEMLRRPERRSEREYECNDTTPLNYERGPHDDELDVSDREFSPSADNPPLAYDNGPHDEEFGVEDDFLPLDDEAEFPED
jgi:hypothetical protein